MNHKTWMVASGILGFALSGACLADTVFMKDGSEIEGTVLESDNNTVVIKQVNGVTRSFRRGDVDTIVKSARISVAAAPQPAPEPPPVQVAPAQAVVPGQPAAPAQPAVPGQPAVPAPGTQVVPVVPAPGVPPTVPNGTGTNPPPAAPGSTDPNNPIAPANPDPNAPPPEKDTWTAPALSSFPDHAKRLPPEKEAIFMTALENLGQLNNPEVVDHARNDIIGMGKDALPYVVAGIQHANVETRTECMKMIPMLDGQRAVKQVIEAFYGALPDVGRPPSYQVPYLDAIKTTISSITGQSFITGQVRDSLIQDAAKQYIDWYNANLMTLPPQLGEKKISETDPDFVKKVTEARQLKLARRSWPVPPSPSDLQDTPNKTNNRPALNESTTQRDADRDWQKDTIKKVDRNDALKRPQDQ